MTPRNPSDPWVLRLQPRQAARLRLFCFPYAGGGVASFAQWPRQLPAQIEVYALQAPGRENRLREPPLRRMGPLAERAAAAIEPYADLPFALFGHSLGALVAFEVACRLRAAGRPLPLHLYVSGRQAPHLADSRPPMYVLPEDSFLAELQRRYGGTRLMLLDDREMRRLLLPALRADVEVIETYRYVDQPPLDCSLSAFRGSEDACTREGVSAWRMHVTGAFQEWTFPGGHFYLETCRQAFLECLAGGLSELLARTGPTLPAGASASCGGSARNRR